MKTLAERSAFTRQSGKRNGEWKIANGMISGWTQREAWSKKLSRNICECTTLTDQVVPTKKSILIEIVCIYRVATDSLPRPC